MNLGQYKALLHDCTKADVQLGIIPTWVNLAQKEICRRRSWQFMKFPVPFTIPFGNGQATLPANFKEPQSGINPLRANSVQSVTGFDLWFLYSKQEMERLGVIGVGAPDRKAYIDFDGTNYIIVTLGQVGLDTSFLLDSYVFPADAVLDTDENFLMREYPMLLLEQAKVYAYRHGAMDEDSGPRMFDLANQSQLEVERQFLIASADDGYRSVRGRRFRMGGF